MRRTRFKSFFFSSTVCAKNLCQPLYKDTAAGIQLNWADTLVGIEHFAQKEETSQVPDGSSTSLQTTEAAKQTEPPSVDTRSFVWALA